MKFLQTVGAVVAAASLSCAAHAATIFSVNGAMTGYQVDPAMGPPGFYNVTFNPAQPAFTGDWTIDILNGQLSGFMDFEAYWAHTEIVGAGTTDVERPDDYHTLDGIGATFSYDAAAHTLSITGAQFNIGGSNGACTATGTLVCDSPDTIYDFDSSLDLVLIFDPSNQSFSGTAVNNRIFASGFIDHTTWSFSGQSVSEVPLPPALWLLGTGLVGLIGTQRLRRRAMGADDQVQVYGPQGC